LNRRQDAARGVWDLLPLDSKKEVFLFAFIHVGDDCDGTFVVVDGLDMAFHALRTWAREVAAIAPKRAMWAATIGDSIELEAAVDCDLEISQRNPNQPKRRTTFCAIRLVFAVKVVLVHTHFVLHTLDKLITDLTSRRKRL